MRDPQPATDLQRPAESHRPTSRPAPKAPPPAVSPEARARGRMQGLAAVGAAAVIAIVVTVGIFLPALGAMTSGGIRPVDVGSLPSTITVCGHEYTRAATGLLTLDQVRTADGREPVVVGARPSCPAGVCVTNGACLSVVYVRTTDDRYAAYEPLDESSQSG